MSQPEDSVVIEREWRARIRDSVREPDSSARLSPVLKRTDTDRGRRPEKGGLGLGVEQQRNGRRAPDVHVRESLGADKKRQESDEVDSNCFQATGLRRMYFEPILVGVLLRLVEEMKKSTISLQEVCDFFGTQESLRNTTLPYTAKKQSLAKKVYSSIVNNLAWYHDLKLVTQIHYSLF